MRFKDFAAFHDAVSYPRGLRPPGMDWSDQPRTVKAYPGAWRMGLPRGEGAVSLPLDAVLAGRAPLAPVADLDSLSRVLRCAHSLTRSEGGPGRERFYRTVASAGALYPAELYVAAAGVEGLQDGLYSLDPERHFLARLREGDVRAHAARAAGLESGGLWFFVTGVFHRSAWKYGARALRYVLLDAGHLLESLAQSLQARGLECEAVTLFDQQSLDDLLGLDPGREACLAVVRAASPAGPAGKGEPVALAPAPEELRRSSRTARSDGPWEEIVSACLATAAGRKPSAGLGPADLGLAFEAWRPFVGRTPLPGLLSYPEAVFCRCSLRDFAAEALDGPVCDALLSLLRPAFSPGPQPVVALLLARAAGDLADGLHVLDLERGATALVRSGAFQERMAEACLGQAWMGAAALHLVLAADFPALAREFGQAGYRAAHLAAGRLGQRLYVAAAALGLGCCGVGAFLDQEARDLLGLSSGSRMLFVLAAGRVRR